MVAVHGFQGRPRRGLSRGSAGSLQPRSLSGVQAQGQRALLREANPKCLIFLCEPFEFFSVSPNISSILPTSWVSPPSGKRWWWCAWVTHSHPCRCEAALAALRALWARSWRQPWPSANLCQPRLCRTVPFVAYITETATGPVRLPTTSPVPRVGWKHRVVKGSILSLQWGWHVSVPEEPWAQPEGSRLPQRGRKHSASSTVCSPVWRVRRWGEG